LFHAATKSVKNFFFASSHGHHIVRMSSGLTKKSLVGVSGRWLVILAGDRLLVPEETVELVLAARSAQAYRPLVQAQILPTVRALPALSDGPLYVRNSDNRSPVLACFELR